MNKLDQYEHFIYKIPSSAFCIQRKIMTKKSMNTLSYVSSVIISTMVTGQKKIDMKSGPMSVSIRKETNFRLSREFFTFSSNTSENTSRMNGGFKIPSLCGTALTCDSDNAIGIQVRLDC